MGLETSRKQVKYLNAVCRDYRVALLHNVIVYTALLLISEGVSILQY